MISDAAKNTIKIFYPSQDPDEALDEVVAEWLDIKRSKIEERVREFERKYGAEYPEFDARIRCRGASLEEEDDWIDWGDYIDLLESLREYRRGILYYLG
ncbi:MAG: hypothetical protein ACE14P_05130 [Methanotrichaceae archaeon]